MRSASFGGRFALPGRSALVACLLAGGCASTVYPRVSGGEPPGADGWEWVEDVTPVRQSSRDGCGAAALAMVLGRWGDAPTEREIRAAIAPEGGDGIPAAALRDFARARGLEAFLIEGELADLDREVARDRPVLVGTMKRRGRRAYPHYEVVVGVNRERRRIVTLDPARGPHEQSFSRFTSEWAAAGRLTLVVTRARASTESGGAGAADAR